jgi:hypothetical protein
MRKIRLIEGFSSLTKQQLFDISAKHVLGNGKPGINAGGTCVYDGIGCAAAPFIVEEDRASAYGTWFSVAEAAKNEHEQDFVRKLQRCHDDAHMNTFGTGDSFIKAFDKKMRVLANEYGLNTEVLDKA